MAGSRDEHYRPIRLIEDAEPVTAENIQKFRESLNTLKQKNKSLPVRAWNAALNKIKERKEAEKAKKEEHKTLIQNALDARNANKTGWFSGITGFFTTTPDNITESTLENEIKKLDEEISVDNEKITEAATLLQQTTFNTQQEQKVYALVDDLLTQATTQTTEHAEIYSSVKDLLTTANKNAEAEAVDKALDKLTQLESFNIEEPHLEHNKNMLEEAFKELDNLGADTYHKIIELRNYLQNLTGLLNDKKQYSSISDIENTIKNLNGLAAALRNVRDYLNNDTLTAKANDVTQKVAQETADLTIQKNSITSAISSLKDKGIAADTSINKLDSNTLFNLYNELTILQKKHQSNSTSGSPYETPIKNLMAIILKKESTDLDIHDSERLENDPLAVTSKVNKEFYKWSLIPRAIKPINQLEGHDQSRRRISHAYKDETFAALLKKYEMNVKALQSGAINKTPTQISKMSDDLAIMRAGLQTLIIKSILDKTDKDGTKERELREQINNINGWISDLSTIDKNYKQEAIALQHTETNFLIEKDNLKDSLDEAQTKIQEFIGDSADTPPNGPSSLASSGGGSDTKQFFKEVAKDTKVAVQTNHFEHDPLIGKKKELKTASMQYVSSNEGFKTELHFQAESLEILKKLKPTDKALSHWAVGSIQKQLNHPTNLFKDKLNINGIGLSKNMIKALILAAYHHNPKVQITLTNCSGVKLTDVTNKELTAFSEALTKTEKSNKNAIQKNSHLKGKENLSDKQTEELMGKITRKGP